MMNSSRATTLHVLFLCAFASLIACSTAFVADRPRSVGRQPKTNANTQLAVIDADLASDLLLGAEHVAASVADQHLIIADSSANDVAANYKTPGGFVFLAYILFSFWAGGVELVKRVQTWQENREP